MSVRRGLLVLVGSVIASGAALVSNGYWPTWRSVGDCLASANYLKCDNYNCMLGRVTWMDDCVFRGGA